MKEIKGIARLMAPLMGTAFITAELLGTPNETMRKNLTGDRIDYLLLLGRPRPCRRP